MWEEYEEYSIQSFFFQLNLVVEERADLFKFKIIIFFSGLTFKEQWQQMQETAKLKAHIRYQEAKIARQNKIKSKSYRRHLRKQKAKEKEKELEELKVFISTEYLLCSLLLFSTDYKLFPFRQKAGASLLSQPTPRQLDMYTFPREINIQQLENTIMNLE